MSSITSMSSKLEEDYKALKNEFVTLLRFLIDHQSYQSITENREAIFDLLRKVMKFQRSLEQNMYTIEQLTLKNSDVLSRLKLATDGIIKKLITEETIVTVPVYNLSLGTYIKHDCTGVIPALKRATRNNKGLDDSKSECDRAQYVFSDLFPEIMDVQEDLNLIMSLFIVPNEKKLELKNQLLTVGFQGVTESLEEAESNLESGHRKDCISRYRDAIEFFVARIGEKETNSATSKKFSIDLHKLVAIGIIDDEIRQIIQASYSYTSMKGSHKYTDKTLSLDDCSLAQEETYSSIDILLRQYTKWIDGKKETNNRPN
jgi:hypothetical protein